MATESQIEQKLVKHARKIGFMCFKFTSPNQRGVPDRIFISPEGAVLFLEVKAPGKKPGPLQLDMIKRLRKQGVACWWADSLTNALAMLADFHHTPKKFNEIYPGT